ncbi:MAG: DNA replication/repair protein RecF [Clostridia bacterium]|nr:DNA replication/repair protein RecF [Clostridia bacterium]MBR2448692.1 DNA replication/repair protein RecF [Clostridia bacterium]
MYIKSLTLKNFRNYEEEQISFNDGINILTGANAQGKTNAAEAIFFLCTGYSPRANKDKLVIKNGEETAEIAGVASSLYGDVSVRVSFNKNDKKSIYVNGLQVLKIGEILGNINSVFFNPSELKLVQESPEDRRRFLNVSLSQMSKNYFYALQRYNKILSQRNNLLKDPEKYIIRETLPIWDEQLTKQAAKIIKARNEFLTQISPIAEEKHAILSDGKETLKMKTESGYYGTEEEIAYAMYQDLKTGLERDMRLGFTSIGPHRDDIKFTLNDMDVRVYGSQGQQRTVALSLKLAETETFFNRFGEYPILILDDVLSELDKKRQRKLISAVEHLQTIFTATGMDRTIFKNKQFNRLIVENGKVKQGK